MTERHRTLVGENLAEGVSRQVEPNPTRNPSTVESLSRHGSPTDPRTPSSPVTIRSHSATGRLVASVTLGPGSHVRDAGSGLFEPITPTLAALHRRAGPVSDADLTTLRQLVESLSPDNLAWLAERVTHDAIGALRGAAAEAGDLDQVRVCDAALGLAHYRVIAVLPDGQTFTDEAHVGSEAGQTHVDQDVAQTHAALLADIRPEGHADVAYRVEPVRTDQAWARAECARVLNASAALRDDAGRAR